MRRFHHAPLPGINETAWLDEAASHHLLRVLRLAVGTELALFDGAGMTCRARLTADEGGRAQVVALTVAEPCAPSHQRVLVLAVLKGPAMDTAVRMATENGATAIRPVLARRGVAKGDRSERWRRLAAAAAQQCGRADVPDVSAPTSLEGALDDLAGLEVRIAVPGADVLGPAAGGVAVLVGPEGGWTADEVALAVRHGAAPMGLGAWTLRADTAAAVAMALA